MKLQYIVYLFSICFIILLITGCVGSNNSITSFVDPRNSKLQQRMDEVINDDYRNSGIIVKPYMKNGDILVFDLQSISGETSRADVFRLFLQFAERNQDMNFQRVELAFRGKTKFYIDGLYYKQLGEEYSYQNPIYTTRKFPSHLRYPNGNQAYSEWTGGWLGVLNEEMDDFLDFHNHWYWDELIQ